MQSMAIPSTGWVQASPGMASPLWHKSHRLAGKGVDGL
jgi:hypothetical protein